jgi:uncharacterized protein (TIGR02246 family)
MPDELTRRVFRTIDSMKPDSIAELFAEDATMVFGNSAPLVGRAAISAGIEGFFSTIMSLQHRIVREWHVAADTVAETEVTYYRLDGNSVAIPVVSIWYVGDDGLIKDYRVFFDLAPVYAL